MIHIDIQKALNNQTSGSLNLQVQLDIGREEIVALYGASGTGKTTLLRILAGLTTPDTGIIKVGESIWTDMAAGIHLKPQQRRTGLVFQNYALFPNMTVAGNIRYGMAENDPEKVQELLEETGLTQLAERYPDTLSGGEQQRVALARALAMQPQILLLDEPLAALDEQIRRQLQDLLLRLQNRFQIPVLLVSHNIGEVWKLAHRVALLENGKITRQGTPQSVFGGNEMSSRFQVTGEILEITPNGVTNILHILTGNRIVKVTVHHKESRQFSAGDKVLVASQAFNPVIERVG